jgi:hypothetical protein
LQRKVRLIIPAAPPEENVEDVPMAVDEEVSAAIAALYTINS